MHLRLWTTLALASVLLSSAALAASQDIGVSSAVNTDATGTAPGGTTRQLAIGQQVVHNEHIVTDAGGQVQILFLDESAMTIGPNSDLTIDEFVYDPRTGTGKLAMNATRGVMRFVGGKLSKNEDAVTMRTPSATIGIRGGIFVMNLRQRGPLDVVFLYGKGLSVVGAAGLPQFITRPGFAVNVAGPGAAPSAPAPAPSGLLAGMLAQVSGKPGATGGSRTPPSEASVASSGVSNTISGNVAASVQQAGVSQQLTAAPTVNVGTVQTQTQQQTVASQASPAVQPQAAAGAVQYTDGFVILLNTSGTSGGQDSFSGTLVNGQLVVPPQPGIDKGGTIPLPQGRASFGPTIVNSASAPLVGTTFLTNDRTAFTAVTSDATGGFGSPNGSTTFIVGGVPTVTLPTTGVASYTGVATGALQSGTTVAPASGGFSATYNFGSQTGSAAFSNFGGKSFSGPIAGAGGNVYAGSLTGSGVNSGVVEGKFFGPGASTTGGVFAASGQTFTAVGVYAGQR